MAKIKRNTLVIILIISVLLSIHYLSIKQEDTYVNRGVFDFDNQYTDMVIPLDGEWEFYFDEFVSSEEFKNGSKIQPDYVRVPGVWSNNTDYSDTGYATYHITVNNIKSDTMYAIKKQNIRLACRIYIDGVLLFEDGIVSNTIKNEDAGNFPQVIPFKSNGNSAEIIIHVSNHKYYKGAIAEEIQFGLYENVLKEANKKLLLESVSILLTICLVVFYIIMILTISTFRKQARHDMSLSAIILLFSIINSTLSERIIKVIFNDITTQATIRIEYVAVSLLFVALTYYISVVSDKVLSKKFRYLIIIIYLAISIVVLVVPEQYFGMFNCSMIITLITLIVYIIRVLPLFFRSDLSEKMDWEYSFLLLVLYIFIVFNLDMILFTIGYKRDMNIAFFTINAFSILWFYLIIYRYDNIYKENLKVSSQLMESYYNLEKVSNDSVRKEIAFLQTQIKPHFLFNSLTNIIGLYGENPDKAINLLTNLSNYLKNIFPIDLSSEVVSVESELNIIYSYVEIEKERFGDRLQVVYDIDDDAKHKKILPLLIQPLIENAIIHGALKRDAGGRVKLSVKCNKSNIIVKVQDNGPGFSNEQKEYVLNGDIDYTKSVGLRNINNRIRDYYHRPLNIDNETDEGVIIWFEIDLKEK